MGGLDFTGKRIGRHLLTTRLGLGTGGSVYQAIDVTLENSPAYAVKCVLKSISPTRRKQQLAEISNHDTVVLCPHVLMLFEAFEEGHYYFLVFPLCEMDMATAIFVKQIYWKNDDLIKRAFLQVLDGVFACHKKGIFHRDLKPENIMCNSQGTKVRIGDFGLSSNRRQCRDGGCGTVPYMSPECLDGKELGYDANQADIWSLGVILYNMVTRRYPWEEAHRADRNYSMFLSRRDYLLRTSPISESLSALLRQIWHPTPMKRLSIPAIRQAIMEMDTFYEPLCLFPAPSRLPKEVPLVTSEQTCVETHVDEKNTDSFAPVDALEEVFRRVELMVLA